MNDTGDSGAGDTGAGDTGAGDTGAGETGSEDSGEPTTPPRQDPDSVRPLEADQVAGSRRPLERLETRVVPFWMVSGLFSVLVLGLIAGAAIGLFHASLPGGRAIPIGVIALLTLLLGWAVIAPPLAFRRWRFGVDHELLIARYGIIFHEEKAIPISRMQHVDLTRGPIERLFGLATLIVFTAGTEGATFRVPGLTPERAKGMRDSILRARGDDVI